jgi:hypothetical protein
MRSTSGPITPPKWRHDPTVANVSQLASNNLAIPNQRLIFDNDKCFDLAHLYSPLKSNFTAIISVPNVLSDFSAVLVCAPHSEELDSTNCGFCNSENALFEATPTLAAQQ